MNNNCIHKLHELYKKDGVDGIISNFNKLQENYKNLPSFINKFAQSITDKDPLSAKKIIEYHLNNNELYSQSYLSLAFIEFRLTNYEKSLLHINTMFEKTNPSVFEAINSANMLIRMGRFKKVDHLINKYFDEAIKDFNLLEPLMYISLKLAKWDYVEKLITIFEKAYSNNNFASINESPRTNLLWCENEVYNNKVTQNWSKRNFPNVSAKKHFNYAPIKNRKIKVAYLSGDFKNHPTSHLINGLIRNHNKSKFELYMLDSSSDDKSSIKKELSSYFDYKYNVLDKKDEEVASLIEELEIDIVVELNGPTKDTRMGVLAYRCAPVQISYLGYPGSAGGRFIDYIIGDNYTVQDKLLNSYNEHVIKIEDIYQVNDYLNKKPLEKVSKKNYGFTKDQIILGVFNSVNKIRKEVWLVWMEVLKVVDNSVLWILDPGEVAFENILKVTKNVGIDTNRILIAPKLDQHEHLCRLQVCDLMLDTWPYSGHTSTADAIFAKVPVLTKKGENFTCRVSGGLLKSAQLEELICDDLEAYKTKAIKLLQKDKLYKKIKKKLKTSVAKSDVFNAKSKTIQLEKAFLTTLKREFKGLPKVHINMKKPKKEPLFSIVTVCKNRLEHLKQTLPLMCKQNNCEVILVDYNCPQKCGEWANLHYPKVKVVKVKDKGEFCLPKGRNAGASVANSEFIFFVDADIFLHGNFTAWISKNCKKGNYYQSLNHEHTSLAGTVIIPKNAFKHVEGYDEAFVGWGGEDDDIYSRLEFLKLSRKVFPKGYITTIEHGDEIRQFGSSESLLETKVEAHKVNSMYRRIKYDLMKLFKQKNLDFEMRQNLMKNVKEQIRNLYENKQTAVVKIKTPPEGIYKLHRTLVYRMD